MMPSNRKVSSLLLAAIVWNGDAIAGPTEMFVVDGNISESDCREPTGPERAELLDGMRQSVARDLRQPVQFRVRRNRICGSWAFIIAEPIKRGGETILWQRTICKGDVSHLVGALEYKDKNGKWTLKDYALCPTDVAWEGWSKKYSAPEAVFAE